MPNFSTAAPTPGEPSPSGAVLAIDYGRKRLGLAISDACRLTSRPLATWTRTNRRRDLTRLRELAVKLGVRHIIVGLPLHLDGTPSEMSEEATGFAARVGKALGVPVTLMDERLSSWEAGQMLESAKPRSRNRNRGGRAGRPGTGRRANLDEVAAALILRDYLERARGAAAARD